jgi:hypothetical protein
MTYPLDLGCTAMRHRQIGIHAVVNARAGQQHLNDEDVELMRDAMHIRDYSERGIRFYQLHSRFFRRTRNRRRIEHLISSYTD